MCKTLQQIKGEMEQSHALLLVLFAKTELEKSTLLDALTSAYCEGRVNARLESLNTTNGVGR